MATVSRTIRFKTEDIEQIDEFLLKNSLFDFSSLARVAIQKFIESPSVTIQPVSPKRPKHLAKEVAPNVRTK